MADHFAVVDVGSNAMRCQVAVVDHPMHYRILEQERQPVRLGRDVFETGKLNPQSAEAALKVLADFKKLADRFRVKALRVVGTSALREASDASLLIRRAAKLGVPLEVLSEQDEARLISLGIMSGLRFHLPLGLFLDIGGGSVELAGAKTTNNFCFFRLPLGGGGVCEGYSANEPPRRGGGGPPAPGAASFRPPHSPCACTGPRPSRCRRSSGAGWRCIGWESFPRGRGCGSIPIP